MNKLSISVLILIVSALFACRPKTSKEPKLAKDTSATKQPIAKQQPKKQRDHVDDLTFVEYLDDGDYYQLLARKGDSTISFINDTDTSRSLIRGDKIKVTWKYDKITIPGDNDSEVTAQILLSVKKTGDGPVARFRKAYGKKLKYTWSSPEEFTSSYLDKVYLLVEYYLAKTKNPLLKGAMKDRDELTYSIESRERNNRSYRVIGIAPVGPNGSNIVQWLYIDEERDQLYEYNLPEDKLEEFN